MSSGKSKRVALRQTNGYESIVPDCIAFDIDLNIHDLRLYMIINSFQRNQKNCTASIAWLTRQMGVSESTVQRSRQTLVNKGYILHFQEKGQWYFQIPMPKIMTDIGVSNPTPQNENRGSKIDTPPGVKSDTQVIKNKLIVSSSSRKKACASLPPSILECLKTHEIMPPANITHSTVRYLDNAILFLTEHDFTIDIYLSYLVEKCSFILLPYEINGEERRNGFSVIFKPRFIKRAMSGEFEDKE